MTGEYVLHARRPSSTAQTDPRNADRRYAPPGTIVCLCTCPRCNFPDAEVRLDRQGLPYRYCPDCGARSGSFHQLASLRPAWAPAPAP